MSTYNGEQYIEEQLDSIQKQCGLENFDVNIVIRDDGSKDKTLEKINKYTGKLNIETIYGRNVGAKQSFYELLKRDIQSDYYAFCDQDDIWNDEKLSHAIKMLEQGPGLYFSNVECISGDGKDLNRRLLSDNFELSLRRIFMCNPAIGTTMVWNHQLNEILLKYIDIYDKFTMHDEYTITIAYLLGKVIYDPEVSMKYRIHNNNVTVSNDLRSKIKITKEIWFGRKEQSLDKRCNALIEKGIMNPVINEMANYKIGINRINLLKKYYCEDKGIERSYKLRMILGIL